MVGESNSAAYYVAAREKPWTALGYIIVGPEGSGKTHLAHIFKQATHATSIDLNASLQELRHEIQDAPACVIDGFTPQQEENLFHVLNILKELEKPFLVFLSDDIDALNLSTEDVKSRLKLYPKIQLDLPDDELLHRVYLKLFYNHQLSVDMTVIEWLVNNCARSFTEANHLVPFLVEESLSQNKKLTVPFVKRLLREG